MPLVRQTVDRETRCQRMIVVSSAAERIERRWPQKWIGGSMVCAVQPLSHCQNGTGKGPANSFGVDRNSFKLLKILVAGARNRHYLLFDALNLPITASM
jgi:hypothetical protein